MLCERVSQAQTLAFIVGKPTHKQHIWLFADTQSQRLKTKRAVFFQCNRKEIKIIEG
jgi:hypothetical protein